MINHIKLYRYSLLLGGWLLLGLFPGLYVPTVSATNSQYFSQTDKTVSGKFLEYWQSNGGLTTFGYPITEAQNEVDFATGKTFLTQWFERNRFELHPENAGTSFEVQLGLLGQYLRGEATGVDQDFVRATRLFDPTAPTSQQYYFEETGHNLHCRFLEYWLQNGGLARFGFPISEEHRELDPLTGKVYITQWFERARFEYHPENKAPYDVLLGLLGKQIKQMGDTPLLLWKMGGDTQSLNQPESIWMDPSGNLYVADTYNHRVLKFDGGGRLLNQWGSYGQADGAFSYPDVITTDPNGYVYVSDYNNRRLQKFDGSGKLLFSFGTRGLADSEFLGIGGLAADQQGNFYVADYANHQLKKYTSEGRLLLKWGGFGRADGQFRNPSSLVLDGEGNLYVADEGNYRIQKFDSNGRFLLKFGSSGIEDGQLGASYYEASYNPISLAVDAQNNLFVGDAINLRVQKFDSKGNFLAKFGVAGKKDGQFGSPLTGVVIDRSGAIYTLERSGVVKKFDASFNLQLKFGDYTASRFFYQLLDVTVDRQGNSYTLEALPLSNDKAISRDYQVRKFDQVGKLLATIKLPSLDLNTNKTERPYLGLAVDSRNYLYVASYSSQILKLDETGKVLDTISGYGANGDRQLRMPIRLTMDSQDNLFVADYGAGNLQKYDSKGNVLLKLSPFADRNKSYYPLSVAVDAQGYVYATSESSTDILKFEQSGKVVQTITTHFPVRSDSSTFLEVTVDAQGNLYVTDMVRGLVQKYDAKGQLLSTWSVPGNAVDLYYLYGNLSARMKVVVDAPNNLYLVDAGNGRLLKYRQL